MCICMRTDMHILGYYINLWKHLDGHIKGDPLVPSRVSCGQTLRGELLTAQDLPSMVHACLDVHHAHVTLVEVVQSNNTHPG